MVAKRDSDPAFDSESKRPRVLMEPEDRATLMRIASQQVTLIARMNGFETETMRRFEQVDNEFSVTLNIPERVATIEGEVARVLNTMSLEMGSRTRIM